MIFHLLSVTCAYANSLYVCYLSMYLPSIQGILFYGKRQRRPVVLYLISQGHGACTFRRTTSMQTFLFLCYGAASENGVKRQENNEHPMGAYPPVHPLINGEIHRRVRDIIFFIYFFHHSFLTVLLHNFSGMLNLFCASSIYHIE